MHEPASAVPPRVKLLPFADLARLVTLCSVAAGAYFLQVRHSVPRDPVVMPWWSLTIACLLVCAVVLYDAWRRPAVVVAALLAFVAAAPMLGWWSYGGRAARRALVGNEFLLLTLLPVAALTVLAARAGSFPWRDYGLGLGHWRWWLPITSGLLVALAVGLPFAGWMFPSLVSYYPADAASRTSVGHLALVQVAILFYMVFWEFLNRGYLLHVVDQHLGPTAAILVQAFPFFLAHAPKPEVEMWASWFGGMALAWFALRSRSIWPSVALHTAQYSFMEIVGYAARHLPGGGG